MRCCLASKRNGHGYRAVISDVMTVNRYYGLEECVTEIEQKLRRDPQSFVPLPGR